GFLGVVAKRGRDDGARVRQEQLGMTRDLGLRHREAHVGEKATRPPVADVALGLFIGFGRRRTDDVDAELVRQLLQLGGAHRKIVPLCKRSGFTWTGDPRFSATRTRPIRRLRRVKYSSGSGPQLSTESTSGSGVDSPLSRSLGSSAPTARASAWIPASGS